MDYIKLVKRSLILTWKYKFLWIFGLFIALVSGGTGMNSSYDFGNSTKNTKELGFENVQNWISSDINQYLFWIIIILIALFVIFLALWILSVISQSALIGCADKLDKGEKTSVKDGITIGKKYFWRIFGISLLFGATIFLSFIILGVPVFLLFYFQLFGRAVLLLMLALLIFVPEAIFLSLIMNYAVRAIVLKDNKIIESIKTAYKLLINNFWQTIVVTLIYIGINIAVSIVIFIAIFLLAVPVIVLILLTKALLGSIVFWICVCLVVLLMIALTLLMKTLLITFKYNLWTLTFKELKNKND
ncbi:MAG: hypothetical protein PHN19_03505 [Patescibacteria group bacterium]|nr:hypothetical protein [Patescibacteria group bacterium]